MRKIISAATMLLLLALVCLTLLTGCTKPAYERYFNDFTSTEGYSKLEKCLTLPKDVFVDGYFENEEMFSVRKDTGLKDDKNKPIYLYGIASKTELLVEPAFLAIDDIKGNLAIVLRVALDENNQAISQFGLIKIMSKGLYSDMTTFHHSALDENYLPIRFVGDFVAILGDRYSVESSDHFTFYNTALEEQFRVASTLFSNFIAEDNYLVHYPDPTVAEFYNTKSKDGNGYLLRQDKYAPFSEEDIMKRSCSIVINYLGNGWFLRTSTVASSQSFSGHNIKLNEKEESLPYVKNVSDRYHADTGTTYNNQSLLPMLVANRYNRAEMRAMSAILNTDIFIAEDGKPLYKFPIYPVSELIKDGYTIVYSYFYLNEETKAVDISFALLEGSAAEPVTLGDIYMPLLFVDGVGFEVTSPYFNPFYLNAVIRDKKNKVTTLEPGAADFSFASVAVHHGGMSVVKHIELTTAREQGSFEAFKGATRAVIFGRYDNEFTPYFSGAATASIYNKKTETRTYYTVNEGGGEVQINGVHSLKNGVYITEKEVEGADGEGAMTYGLFTNSGVELLANRPNLQVYESFLKNGKFVESLVFTEENGGGVVYKLI